MRRPATPSPATSPARASLEAGSRPGRPTRVFASTLRHAYHLARRSAECQPALHVRDAASNARWRRQGSAPVLLVRHPRKTPYFYGGFLRWLATNFPELRTLFRLALLPAQPFERGHAELIVPWLQDPIESWSAEAYVQAVALAEAADALGVGVINRPQNLSNTVKSRTASILESIGIRTPRMMRITGNADLEELLDAYPRPFFVRNDEGHGGPIHVVRAGGSLDRRDLCVFATPVAIEYVDTRSEDGLFRKFRYQAAGVHGISVHALCSREWEVRGHNKIVDAAALREEADHVSGVDPNHAILQAARVALGLDFVAFDYAYDRHGRLTVWEANGYPNVHFGPPSPALRFREAPVHRVFAALAGLYLDRIKVPVPRSIDLLRNYLPGDATALAGLRAPIALVHRLQPLVDRLLRSVAPNGLSGSG